MWWELLGSMLFEGRNTLVCQGPQASGRCLMIEHLWISWYRSSGGRGFGVSRERWLLVSQMGWGWWGLWREAQGRLEGTPLRGGGGNWAVHFQSFPDGTRSGGGAPACFWLIANLSVFILCESGGERKGARKDEDECRGFPDGSPGKEGILRLVVREGGWKGTRTKGCRDEEPGRLGVILAEFGVEAIFTSYSDAGRIFFYV